MKKRFWSLLLVLVMVLTMIPTTAYEANGTKDLMFRMNWMTNGNVPVENGANGETCDFEDSFTATPGDVFALFFHVVENGESTERVTGGMLTSSNEDVVRVSMNTENGDATTVEAVGFGTATISYGNYSLDVTIMLPDFGMYSSPVYDAAKYLSTFKVTDTENTFYIVPSSNYSLTNVELDPGLEDIADLTFNPADNYATVKVTGTPDNFGGYGIYVSATHLTGDFDRTNQYYNLRIQNGKTSLVSCCPDFSNDRPEMPSNPYWDTTLRTWPGRTDTLFFALMKDGVAGNLVTNITTSNPNVVSVYTEAGSNIVRIEAVGMGSAELIYTDGNNNTYKMPVTVALPEIGVYSTNQASPSTLLNNGFEVTEENKTFYLISTIGDFVSVTLEEDLDDITDLKVGGGVAAITVTGTPDPSKRSYRIDYQVNGYPENFYNVSVYTPNQGGNDSGGPGMPEMPTGLLWHYEDDADSTWGDAIYGGIGGQTEGWFIFHPEDSEPFTLTVDDLTVTNKDVVRITSVGTLDNPDKIKMEFLNWGTSKIVFRDPDGNEYAFIVENDLDHVDVGFYTSTKISEETYIPMIYTVTNDDNVVYLNLQHGFQMQNIRFYEEAEEYGIVEKINDFCYKFTITDEICEYFDYGELVDFTFLYDVPGGDRPHGNGITIINKMCKHSDTEVVGQKAASCLKNGYRGDTVCKQCKELLAKGSDIAATGHSYVNGKCKDCGDKPVVPEKVEVVDTTKPVKEVTPVVEQEVADTAAKEVSTIVDAILSDKVTEEVKEAVSEETIEEIKKEIAAGKEITTAVVAKPIEEKDVDKEVVKEIEKELGAAGKVAQFLDLSIMIKSVAADGAEKDLGTLNVLGEKVKFTIVVPEDLVKEGREFYIVRVHDGEAEILDLTKNADGTYSFETDKFSTYALAYEEVEEAVKDVVAPKTGDTTNVMPYIVLIAVAFVAFALSKKENYLTK